MESRVLAAGKLGFAVEVGDSALDFVLKTMNLDGLSVVLAGSAVEKGVSAVEKESTAVGGESSAVELVGWNE